MKKQLVISICAIMVAAGGCAKKEVIKPEASVPPSAINTAADQAPATEKAGLKGQPESAVRSSDIPATATASGQQIKPVDGGDLNAAKADTDGPFNTIYFDFDSHLISLDARNDLKKNADLLRKNQQKKLVIEGHCDERGSDEYNMALGQKRAQAAVEYLRYLGVDTSRLSAISYGEEKPSAQGHDEASWAKNRRDEFHWQ